jgi:adenylate cyclase
MPYDVLFILNQFFSEMTAALHQTGGHYAQFTGDGLMALYGLDNQDDPSKGVRAALAGAAEMLARLEGLNRQLKADLDQPLKMGIGMHHGVAIVGSMGPPTREIITAIGDTINTAARLEAKTKEHGVPLVVSEEAAAAAGLTLDPSTLVESEVRGRKQTARYFTLSEVPDIGLGRRAS